MAEGREQTCHHAASMLDHGTYFPQCCCGWLGVATLSRERSEREVQAHLPPCTRREQAVPMPDVSKATDEQVFDAAALRDLHDALDRINRLGIHRRQR